MRSIDLISSRFSPFKWFKNKKRDGDIPEDIRVALPPPSNASVEPHTNGHSVSTITRTTESFLGRTPSTVAVERPKGYRPRRRHKSNGNGPPVLTQEVKEGQTSANNFSPPGPNASQAKAARPAGPISNLFGEIPVSNEIARALAEMGYREPSPVQTQVIPVMIDGRDVVGQPQTGTGKTAAFGIPLAQTLSPDLKEIQAIVLVPTRELCIQVSKELQKLGKYRGIKAIPVYGGQAISTQFRLLEQGAHIIVGTPGRVMDHMGRGTISLNHIKVAVLDEADRMLDIGFAPDMERILSITPKDRQTTLFSATIPPFLQRMVRRYMKDPVWVRIHPEQATVPEIQQVYYEVAERDKLKGVESIIGERGKPSRTLIFCNMQVAVDRLTSRLLRLGYNAEGIHGGMPQPKRLRALSDFKEGKLNILVATNVASRGLDIPEVTHVINYDAPQNSDDYIHRIGRTGRMGRSGLASTFIAEWDFEILEQVRDVVGDSLEQGTLSIYSS